MQTKQRHMSGRGVKSWERVERELRTSWERAERVLRERWERANRELRESRDLTADTDLNLNLSLTETVEKAKSYRKFKIRWRSTCKKVAALNFVPHDEGGDLPKIRRRSTYEKAAIYIREGGDLRTDKVTYWAPCRSQKKQCFYNIQVYFHLWDVYPNLQVVILQFWREIHFLELPDLVFLWSVWALISIFSLISTLTT